MSLSSKQKMYYTVLEEIRNYIDQHQLTPGDKLPSERELSEKLETGRSSVREALRAMELLGLIETRQGEGTFLGTYNSFQTVELISSFVLRDTDTQNDLVLIKRILEKEAAKLAFYHITEKDINKLKNIVSQYADESHHRHVAFFNHLFNKTENLLLHRIWQLIEKFAYTIHKNYDSKSFYDELICLYAKKKYAEIEDLFRENNFSA